MNHYKEISVLLVLYQEDINLIIKNLINLKNFKIIIVDNDSILGQPNCTALYTIALSNDANTVSIVEAGSVNT